MSVNLLSSSAEEQENLAIIERQNAHLTEDHDKFSRSCPRLTDVERYSERQYTHYFLEEITYLDYHYCVNKTRLPGLWSLRSFCTLFRVSFFQEVWLMNEHCNLIWQDQIHAKCSQDYHSTEKRTIDTLCRISCTT
jgi:hypothetical protein